MIIIFGPDTHPRRDNFIGGMVIPWNLQERHDLVDLILFIVV